MAVPEDHFKEVTYKDEFIGEPIKLIIDVRRNENNNIQEYCLNTMEWVSFEIAFKMVCSHKIANGRPVFKKNGLPYIRTKRDKLIINNLTVNGKNEAS